MHIQFKGTSIGSIAALAKTLDVSQPFLEAVVADASAYYSVSCIPKKSGGTRAISDPVKELKILQRRILKRIFSNCSFPLYLYGSVKDKENPRDFLRNASAHSHAVDVMAFDIEAFFPSVQARFVKKVFKYLFNFPEPVSKALVALTTLDGTLPQGAPTSPYIANLIFYDVEHKLESTLRSKGFVYTRLVDDITVSSPNPISSSTRGFVYNAVRQMLKEKELVISKKKYKVTNTGLSGNKTIVTGLVVESKMVKLPKEKIKEIGGKVHILKNMAAVDKSGPDFHALFGETSGLVALYTRLDESKALHYREILRSVMPVYAPKKVKKVAWLCRNFVRYAKSHPDQRDVEGYAKKYWRYKNKISIIRRTNRLLAASLAEELRPYKPIHLLSSYYE
jgi:hypothetical protein